MLMYPYHLQSWWDFGVLIFLMVVQFWLRGTGQIQDLCAFSGQRMEVMAWNFACQCILTTFRAGYILVMAVDFQNLGLVLTWPREKWSHISGTLYRVLSSFEYVMLVLVATKQLQRYTSDHVFNLCYEI